MVYHHTPELLDEVDTMEKTESRVHLVLDVKVTTNMHLALKSVHDIEENMHTRAQRLYPEE